MMLVRFILLLLGMFWSVIQGDGLTCWNCSSGKVDQKVTSKDCGQGEGEVCFVDLGFSSGSSPAELVMERGCTSKANCNKAVGSNPIMLKLCCDTDKCNPLDNWKDFSKQCTPTTK